MSKHGPTSTKTRPDSITAQQAVAVALHNFAQVIPAVSDDLRLEEVFLDESEQNWLTTLSFPNPDYEAEQAEDTPSTSNWPMFEHKRPKRRIAKRIKLRASDGKFIGILNA